MARTCRGLTAPTTSAPRHWNAESGQQQDLTPKDSERSHGPRRSANVGVSLRRVHERRGSQALDSGVSQHWGAGAVPGPGFESGKRFFLRGAFTRPKREKESDGCPPPLHPPPAGMQAYAVACMPQSTRRRLRSHRRFLFRKSEVSTRRFVRKQRRQKFQKAFRKQRLQTRRREPCSRALRVAPSGGLGSIKYGGTSR